MTTNELRAILDKWEREALPQPEPPPAAEPAKADVPPMTLNEIARRYEAPTREEIFALMRSLEQSRNARQTGDAHDAERQRARDSAHAKARALGWSEHLRRLPQYAEFIETLIDHDQCARIGDRHGAEFYRSKGARLCDQLTRYHLAEQGARRPSSSYMMMISEQEIAQWEAPPQRSIDHLREKEAKRKRRNRR